MVIISSILNYLRQERGDRTTRTLLHNMDDHLLQDIGVRRDQIDSLISEQRKVRGLQTAADAKNRRNRQGSKPAFGRHGLAAQH